MRRNALTGQAALKGVKTISRKPAFLITIDTEGDNLWSSPRTVTTQNANFLPRFQVLCDKFGLRPTYLTNYEMVSDPVYQEFAKETYGAGKCEIGMHLHAWDSPPLIPLTSDDIAAHPYLIEYPDAVMREKIHVLTVLLEDTFGVKMLSHRAGRWSFDDRYARILLAEGYQVDCSVTPHVSWTASMGNPLGHGGSDYTDFPDKAYWISPDNIAVPGLAPGLLEVPVSIVRPRGILPWRKLRRLLDDCPSSLRRILYPVRRTVNYLSPSVQWLRPNMNNTKQMISVLQGVLDEKRDYAEFILHSSEFMPGGSPTFRTEDHIEILYEQLEQLFGWISGRFEPATLTQYRERFLVLSS